VRAAPPRRSRATLVSFVAFELWRLHGGNQVLNWLEAERLVDEILDRLRAEA